MANDKNTQTQRLAIDIGSGDTKYMYKDKEGKEHYGKFPSAVCRAKTSPTDFGSETSAISFEGSKYLIGENALDRAISNRTVDYQIKYSPLLAYGALEKANFDLSKPVELCIGLTIKDWGKREEIKERLETIIVNNEKIDTKVVAVFAQGQGAYIDENAPQGKVAIIDGGYNTLDFIAMKDGKPISEICFATDYGANKMITNIQSFISKRYDTNISEHRAKEIFNEKSFSVFGEKNDLSEMVKEEQEAYLDELMLELSSRVGDFLKMADEVIFTGGLAYFLKDVELPKNARLGKAPHEFSNVRGYYYG